MKQILYSTPKLGLRAGFSKARLKTASEIFWKTGFRFCKKVSWNRFQCYWAAVQRIGCCCARFEWIFFRKESSHFHDGRAIPHDDTALRCNNILPDGISRENGGTLISIFWAAACCPFPPCNLARRMTVDNDSDIWSSYTRTVGKRCKIIWSEIDELMVSPGIGNISLTYA